jgi:integration host factor subunit beta
MAQDLGGMKDRNKSGTLGRDALAAEVVRALDAQGILSIPKVRVREVVDEVFSTLTNALYAGLRVEIRGFGSLVAHRRNARRSFVPTKQKVMKVDARWTVLFRTPKEVKRKLMEHLEA